MIIIANFFKNYRMLKTNIESNGKSLNFKNNSEQKSLNIYMKYFKIFYYVASTIFNFLYILGAYIISMLLILVF